MEKIRYEFNINNDGSKVSAMLPPYKGDKSIKEISPNVYEVTYGGFKAYFNLNTMKGKILWNCGLTTGFRKKIKY